MVSNPLRIEKNALFCSSKLYIDRARIAVGKAVIVRRCAQARPVPAQILSLTPHAVTAGSAQQPTAPLSAVEHSRRAGIIETIRLKRNSFN